ncbi:MAG TPA: TraR/DksA C4-type zinc finger protein [Pyrinomonadaceae bacterium]|nr:TraR/DksA C4-type zinc finger protein [Pyrinomonadaceae bacterium]
MDGILLESLEGLGHSPFVTAPGESWELLQAEKEVVSRELLARDLREDDPPPLESDAAEKYALEMRWHRRQHLEARLREVREAQDRLNEGTYGRCIDCGAVIDDKRLLEDPAVSRCIGCQRNVDSEYTCDYRSAVLLVH